MSFLNIFRKKQTQNDSIKKIIESMDLLVEKASNLNSQFEEEQQLILKLSEDAKTIVHSDEIISAKFEQEILTVLTQVSFILDSALAGSNQDQLKKGLNELSKSINQRLALQK